MGPKKNVQQVEKSVGVGRDERKQRGREMSGGEICSGEMEEWKQRR